MADERARLAEGLHANARQWTADGSNFYGVLAHHIADDVAGGGPCWPVLQGHSEHPLDEVPGIRLLGGVHRTVLQGRAPELARHYQSVGGDGDAEAAWPHFRELVEENADELTGWVDHVPQTNEVGRSIALVGAWLVAASATGMPLRLLEPGCSAGLNLRADNYWYEQGGVGLGEPDSPVRFVDCWEGGRPPLEAWTRIASRKGCDRFPIDATSEDGRLTLLSYVWPDEHERFDTLASALAIAHETPVALDRDDACAWLERELAVLPEGEATVVYHSYFWMYLDDEDRACLTRVLADAGGRATTDAPFFHVSLEAAPGGDYAHSELRIHSWPDDDERLLGTCLVHPHTVQWLD
jgi:hypothetical protein